MTTKVLRYYITFVVILFFFVLTIFGYGKAVNALAGFNSEIQNSINSENSGTLILTDTIGAVGCQSSANLPGAIASNSANCSDYPLSQSTNTATNINMANTGSLLPATATISSYNCGVQQLVDSSKNDTALANGYLNYMQTGPAKLAGSYSIGLNGSNGYGETLSYLASPGPQTFSIAAWFKTATDGSIIGFTNSQTNTGQSYWDRHLWIDDTGHLVFGLYPNGIYELKSPSTFNNNAWHFVVVTVSPSTTTQGSVSMYVDGNLVAGGPNSETYLNGATQPAQVYGGWWHLGWSNADQSWPDGPTNPYFSGSLGQIAIFGTSLTATQVSTIYSSANGGQYSSNVTGSIATSTSYWTLQSFLTSNTPCDDIGVTIGDLSTGTCVYPIMSSPCPLAASAGGLDLTENISPDLGSFAFTAYPFGTVPANIVNLHATVTWQVQTAYGGFSAMLMYNDGFVYI